MPLQSQSVPDDLAALRKVAVVPLTPDQAVDARYIGKRIRWAGSIHHIAPSETGACLTLSYMRSGDDGAPLWQAAATDQSFRACTVGAYDRQLVSDFTTVTIIGRISGKADVGMGGAHSTGPAVEIEKLFRWSDCLSGDTSPVCKIGFVTLTVPSRD